MQQINLGSLNPNHIYMYNGRIGYITEQGGGTRYVRKTTDSGISWTQILINDDFIKIYFTDSLTGWKCSVFGMKKTTDGGLNWVTQTLPSGGIIQTNNITSFSNINKDTIWANGGYVMFPNSELRSILNRTTNGGNTWLFQIPDTGKINTLGYVFVNFVNKLNGWVTNPIGLIHTTSGGDTTWLSGLQQISSNIPINYKLSQNYPNPFNPITNIKYSVKRETSNVKLIIYDVQGKLIAELVNQKHMAGTYQVDFSGIGLSSGVYFYSLIADGALIETRK